MAFDRVLEKEIKKFGIDPEIKTNVAKYFTPEEKWEIVKSFFQSKEIGAKVGIENKSRMIVFNFSSAKNAKDFADMPSEGLAAFARQWLRDKGEDFKIYDIHFNLGVTYEEKDEKTSKKVVVRMM